MLKLKNDESTPKEVILDQLQESRPLPTTGRAEFEEWSDRIISGANLAHVTPETAKHALACLLMHIGPTEDHKTDAYFIKALRVNCVKIIATDVIQEMQEKRKAALKEAAEKKEAELVKKAVEGK
jgi:hypothetical protein